MNKIINVLITGGLGGIGLDICKYLIRKNFNNIGKSSQIILEDLTEFE